MTTPKRAYISDVLSYKYQLLYVYVSRAESGGRMWNVYCNRLIACCILMQLLMILSESYASLARSLF